MEFECYRKQIRDLKSEYKEKEFEIHKSFALSRNKIKIGDFVIDHIGKVLVEKIKISIDLQGVAYCSYYGSSYTKAGKPRKDGERRMVHHMNVIKDSD